MAMDKGVLSEAHPQFVGTYAGGASSPAVREAVEGADLVIDAGGVSFNDINTSAYSSRIAPEKLVSIGIDHVRIGSRIYNPVRMNDVFDLLARSVRKNFGYSAPAQNSPGETRRQTERPGHRSGAVSAVSGLPEAVGPNRHRERQQHPRHCPASPSRRRRSAWPAPLGLNRMATGATLGIALADPSRRTVLFTGEGSHQLTANDIGTISWSSGVVRSSQRVRHRTRAPLMAR